MDSYNTADANGNGATPIPEEEEDAPVLPSAVGADVGARLADHEECTDLRGSFRLPIVGPPR